MAIIDNDLKEHDQIIGLKSLVLISYEKNRKAHVIFSNHI